MWWIIKFKSQLFHNFVVCDKTISILMPTEAEFKKGKSIVLEETGEKLYELIQTLGIKMSDNQKERFTTYAAQKAITEIGLKFQGLAYIHDLQYKHLYVTAITGEKVDPKHLTTHRSGVHFDLSNMYINLERGKVTQQYREEVAVDVLRSIATTENITQVVYHDRKLWDKALDMIPEPRRSEIRKRNIFREEKKIHSNHIHVQVGRSVKT